MIEAADLNLIDKYLRHEMTQEDVLTLEQRKKSNDFTTLLSEMEFISESLSEVGAEQLKNVMKQWYREDVPLNKFKTKVIRWVSLAASILLLCALLVWNYSSKKYERLSHSYATDFPDYISQVKRGQGSVDKTYAHLMLPYQGGNWEEALSSFDTYLSDHPDDFKIELYRGVTLFQDKDNKKAIASFQGVLNKTDNTTFAEPARWYLILSYVADDQVEKATQMLTQLVANHQHFNYDKAKELLNILSK